MPQFSKDQFYKVKNYNIEDEDEKETTTKIEYCKCQRISNGNYKKVCKNGPVSSRDDDDVKKSRKRREVITDVNINAASLSYILDLNPYQPVIRHLILNISDLQSKHFYDFRLLMYYRHQMSAHVKKF